MSVMDRTPGAAGMASPATLSVVVVDSQPVVLEGLDLVLGREGMVVVGAFADPAGATEFLLGGSTVDLARVDLVVVEVQTGRHAGLELIAALQLGRPQVQVVVLTGVEDGAVATQAIRAGARGFLLKDVASNELCRSLRSVAEGNLVVDSRMASAILAPNSPPLSANQIAIVELVAAGLTNRQIGARLHLSEHTIRTYLSRAMRTLGTSSRAETVVQLSLAGWIDVG